MNLTDPILYNSCVYKVLKLGDNIQHIYTTFNGMIIFYVIPQNHIKGD